MTYSWAPLLYWPIPPHSLTMSVMSAAIPWAAKEPAFGSVMMMSGRVPAAAPCRIFWGTSPAINVRAISIDGLA